MRASLPVSIGTLHMLWQKYIEKQHPSSRDLDSVMAGHDLNIHAKSAQLSFFFFQFWLLTSPAWHGFQEDVLAIDHPSRCTSDVSDFFSFGHETGDISEQLVKVPVLLDNFAETTG